MADPAGPLVWVVGSGGLLGRSVVDAARRAGVEVWHQPRPVPWADPAASIEVLRTAAALFMEASRDRPWWVLWCAGTGSPSTPAEALVVEREVFGSALDALAVTSASRASGEPTGAVFLASSAGGVYGGSTDAPFDEHTEPVSISPYGDSKLLQEQQVNRFHDAAGVSVLVGRIANLYGPGQNLAKPQGLISHLCRAHLKRRPISIYVPLDTMRNYIFAPDCGLKVVAAMMRLQSETEAHGAQSVTKVLAGPHAVSVGYVVAELGRVAKRRPLVVFAASPASAYQAMDLRLRSVTWPEVGASHSTSFASGLHQTLQGLARSLAAGDLT